MTDEEPPSAEGQTFASSVTSAAPDPSSKSVYKIKFMADIGRGCTAIPVTEGWTGEDAAQAVARARDYYGDTFHALQEVWQVGR